MYKILYPVSHVAFVRINNSLFECPLAHKTKDMVEQYQ
jgi:hypothetical protein